MTYHLSNVYFHRGRRVCACALVLLASRKGATFGIPLLKVQTHQNFIERAVILSPGSVLRPPLAELQEETVQGLCPKLSTLEEAEREHVLRAIRECNWVIGGPNGAAARLGMKRTTLAYRIRKLKIPCRPE